ncbi:response regulator [Flaviaesturariibacter amylovorans]|uniref:Response regulatory domain-containing protein n=1 Tax=Flaviaesturariibacter amylovorans TaxID=1084520 RepID=A0ABP8H4X8_9BACT
MIDKCRILYDDDDPDDREMMQSVFQPHPAFRLATFENGQELLDYLAKVDVAEICLIQLDVNMPKLGGVETLKAIRRDERLKSLDVLMLSTSTSPIDKERAASLQAELLINR